MRYFPLNSAMSNQPATLQKKISPLALAACGAFLVANLFIPFTLGDVYPFTVAPMFRDAPRRYENIRVFKLDGSLLADNSTRRVDPLNSPDPFLLRRYYDGNPVGYGVGVRPPNTLDEFGVIHDEAAIRSHLQKCLQALPDLAAVDVEREIVGPIDGWKVGVEQTNRWRIVRDKEAAP